jgi:UDP-3-O-acyl N-acetylglucosamine deacetylase
MGREVATRLAATIKNGRFQKEGGTRWLSTNTWVILSTTVDLQKIPVEEIFGKELSDLIEVEPLRVPPLRERWEDIPSLIEHFLSQFCSKLGLRRPVFEEQAIEAIEEHHWPENIKALKNIVERLVVEGTGDVIGLSHLPREVQGVPSEKVDVKSAAEARDEAEWEKEVLSKLLFEQKGNLRQAASQLGISEGRLRGKIKEYGLDASGKKKRKTCQRTLGKSVLLGGQGLHSGLKTGLILSPLPPNSGIRIGGITSEESVPAHLDLVVSTNYATTLHQGAITIRTVEHLMSALHAYNITNVLVKVTDEIPIMDGSAQDFCRLIEEAEIVEQEAFVEPLEVSSVIEVVSNGRNGQQPRLKIEPFPDLVVDYQVVLPEPIGEQQFTFKLDKPESFRDSIAPARTFGLIREVEKQEKKGLVGGGRLDNVILLDGGRVVNTQLRFPDEFARHKILDIIGDLYLLGRPVKGKVTGRMSGHAENIELLRKLRAQ